MNRSPDLLRVTCALLVIGTAGAGCRSPIGAQEVGPEKTYHALNAHVLNQDVLSQDTRAILNRFDLEKDWEPRPVETIRALHAIARETPFPALLYSLAELSYSHAEWTQEPGCYLSAAVYAYLYLFDDVGWAPNPFDRRYRVACDLYNYGLLKAFRSRHGDRYLMAAGTTDLLVGQVELSLSRTDFPWSEGEVNEFMPADQLSVRGFSSRRRDAGLGVPLVALYGTERDGERLGAFLPRRISLPATAFLRLEGGLEALDGGIQGVLELHSAFDVPSLTVGSQTVPLEVDLTAPLAYQLAKSDIWDFELGAFFSQDDWEGLTGLYMTAPYQEGKIPVVFVHGTASSPARWAQMFNQLSADRDLRAKFQFWYFIYTTGNPIVYSASLLNDALTDIVSTLDPTEQDPALQQMVVIGHSQGGLLTKMQAIHTGDKWVQSLSEEVELREKLTEEEFEYLGGLFRVDPNPSVKRVVFVATPHRGSYVAGNWIGRLASRFVSAPAKLTGFAKDLVTNQTLMEKLGGVLPTSVDNMDPDNRFVRLLGSTQVDPAIPAHSIIAVKREGPLEDQDDGVVKYTSAHIEESVSEFVVRSGHSCQANPLTIQEVRRILLEHLRAVSSD